MRGIASAGTVSRGRNHRPGLHLIDLRIEDPETDSTGAQHRIRLLKLGDDRRVLPCLLKGYAVVPSLEFSDARLEVLQGKELVERRIEETDRDQQAPHLVQDRLEVASPQLLKALECGAEF